MRPFALVAVLLMAGCMQTAAPHDVPKTFTFHAMPDGLDVALRWFVLAEPTRVAFAFDVGDGGVAMACFIDPSGVDTWKLASPEPHVTYHSGHMLGCVEPREAASASVMLDAGEWAFALRSGPTDCPALDCRVRFGVDAPHGEYVLWRG